MKIGAISELEKLIADISQLSTSDANFIEVSHISGKDSSSLKFDFGGCIGQLVKCINSLSTAIDDLSSNITNVRNTYLPLSGGKLTGELSIDLSPNGKTALTINGASTAINATGDQDSTFTSGIYIKDNVLHSKSDINGCAVMAKWA